MTRGTKSQSSAAARANTSAARHPDMALSAARAASSTVVHGGKVGQPGRKQLRRLDDVGGAALGLVAREPAWPRGHAANLFNHRVGALLPWRRTHGRPRLARRGVI